MKLQNKVAIVSGGARDIGRAISIKLASEGAKVVFSYLDSPEQAEETVELIKSAGGEAIAVQGNMTIGSEVAKMVQTAKEAYGDKVDILVNVVGGLVGRKTLEEMDEEFFDFVISVNLKSVFLLMKHVTPLMSAGSSVINFASVAARDGGGPGASAYATGKGAVATFTRSMAKELGPKGIRVNALNPGMIATAFHDTFTKPEVRANVANGTPLRREGKASEIADLVCYLSGDESTFITGANIDINGGIYFS